MFWDKKNTLLFIVSFCITQIAIAMSTTQDIDNLSDERCHSFPNYIVDYKGNNANYSQRMVSHQGIKKYRLAITTTGEFSQYYGGTVEKTLQAIVAIVDQVNQIYERDLGIRLELIPNNHQLIFTDPEQDPFNNSNPTDISMTNQNVVDSIIGSENYDVGHVFSIQGGGVGYINSVCDSDHKAMGFSGINQPIGKRFAIDFFAHELGHQFAAQHTFNGQLGICKGQRNSLSAVEPGSGSSIMSYAGFCGSDNVKLEVESLFHLHSMRQIRENISSGKGSQCGEIISQTKVSESLTKTYVIPANTPLELKLASSNKANSLYAWHQMDIGNSTKLGVDSGNNPLIAPLVPTSSPVRTIPKLSSLMSGTHDNTGILPKKTRTVMLERVSYHHSLLETSKLKLVVINNNKTFGFTQVPRHITAGGVYLLNWETAETDVSPISCSSVNISLSTNLDRSFKHVLAVDAINNGEMMVMIPNDLTVLNNPRFKIACNNNLFFAVSSEQEEEQLLSLKNGPSAVSPSLDNNPLKLASASFERLTLIVCMLLLLGRYFRKKLIGVK